MCRERRRGVRCRAERINKGPVRSCRSNNEHSSGKNTGWLSVAVNYVCFSFILYVVVFSMLLVDLSQGVLELSVAVCTAVAGNTNRRYSRRAS